MNASLIDDDSINVILPVECKLYSDFKLAQFQYLHWMKKERQRKEKCGWTINKIEIVQKEYKSIWTFIGCRS